MHMLNSPFRVAAVQAAPVFMDREATIDQACELILEAGRQGARLVAFPESFIPGYPYWVWAVPAGEQALLNAHYAEFLASAVDIPSDPLDKICRTARRTGTYVVLGVTERAVEANRSSLYNALVFIDARGEIRGKHRQLAATGAECLVWAEGDGTTLSVFETPLGKIGGLIGSENYMPLARCALYMKGLQIYIAASWQHGEPWLSTLRHVAKEARACVLGVGIPLHKDDIPDRFGIKDKFYNSAAEWINTGDSAIVNSEGEFIAGPLHRKQEILYAEIDPIELRRAKWRLDTEGDYARPELFRLVVHPEPRGRTSKEDDSRKQKSLEPDSAQGI